MAVGHRKRTEKSLEGRAATSTAGTRKNQVGESVVEDLDFLR